jgi:signal transduction histidine kinase/FixJ family two-component response regulator
LTYQELAELLERHAFDPPALAASAPDEPLPYLGGLFPVSGGLLKAASIEADLMDDAVVVIEGPDKCLAALRQIREGDFPARFVDALLCEGCIAGPAFNDNRSPLARKALVTAHVRSLQRRSREVPRWLREVRHIDVRRDFEAHPVTLAMPTETEIRDILARTNKHSPSDELNCGACGYPTCRDKAIAVYQGLAEPEMCLPYLIDQLEVNLERLGRSKEEIDRARNAATRAQQLASMGRLASDIAHELGNPLSKIIVFARLLADNMPETDPRREDLTAIIAEAVHSREVLSSLEGFARERAPQFEDVNLADVVARALEEVGPALALSQAKVEQDLQPDLPPLTADPALLSQVLVHLLSNSLDAVGPDGVIRISAALEPDGKYVRLEVTDNGHGIDPALLPRLFEPFVTTKTDRPGAGLGLAASHGIVEAHGGQMDIRSTPNVGTTVTVRLPTHARPVAPPRAPKVLVVDDDPDFLEQHRIVLSGLGFEVVCAERSDEALEVANREIPDAFVLDLMMERTDSGARLARALRRDPRFRKAPIIMLTSVVREVGFEFHRNPQEVLEWMKADAWFDKPAPVMELGNTIRRLLADPERRATDSPADASAPEA